MQVKDVNKLTVKELKASIIENKAPDKALDKVLDEAPDKLKETIKKIILYCQEPKSAIQIMEELNYKNIKRFRRDYIKPLVEKKILKMTIPDKPTSKNQKYISNSTEK